MEQFGATPPGSPPFVRPRNNRPGVILTVILVAVLVVAGSCVSVGWFTVHQINETQYNMFPKTRPMADILRHDLEISIGDPVVTDAAGGGHVPVTVRRKNDAAYADSDITMQLTGPRDAYCWLTFDGLRPGEVRTVEFTEWTRYERNESVLVSMRELRAEDLRVTDVGYESV